MPKSGYNGEVDRDIQAGVEMARHLLGLPSDEFAKYREMDLHRVPRASWNRLDRCEQERGRRIGIHVHGDDHQTHAGRPIEEFAIPDQSAESFQGDADEENEAKASTQPLTSISDDERIWYVVRQVLDIILAQPNARLSTECFRISSGLGFLDDVTEASIARKHGITRAAVSKRCVRQTRLLGLKPSQYMRPMHQRETYRKARLRSLKKMK